MKLKLSKTELVLLKDGNVEASFMYFNHDYIVYNFSIDGNVFTRVINMREAKTYLKELVYEGFIVTTIIPRR